METKKKRIADQVIVITGASSGIGLATARMAAKQGATVVLSSRNTKDLEEIVDDIKANDGKAMAVTANVTVFDDLKALRTETLQAYGRIDTWINNAGASIFGELLRTPIEEERELFETNFWGVRNGCHIAIPELTKTSGTLINLGSEVSARSVPLMGMYSATKHAVKAFTDALRMELEKNKSPVAVCLIRPAGINTPFPDHAQNRLTYGEPSLPSSVFHPDVAAKAILDCAENPTRDVYVGGRSRVSALLDTMMPGIVDLFMEKVIFNETMRGTKTSHSAFNEGLMHAPEKEGQIEGRHIGKILNASYYTLAKRNPWLGLATVGIGLAILGTKMKAKKKLAALEPKEPLSLQ